ncbi:MAG: GvpL/GvpF family gas vesicle protein [Solirubrobacterales bacterium]|nr:GvpL/GvpF family gas vesicle protein [Solirubrobacterales bacterium]
MNDEKRTWIYGIVPAGAALKEVERREGLPEVWVIEAGDLGAIVGDAPQKDGRATRDQAVAHARVLEAAVADAPVVPMRFGTMVPGGDDEVGSELLEAHHDEFAKLLGTLKDQVQLTLKAYYREQEVMRDIIEGNPEIAQLRDQSREGPEAATRGARVQLGEMISNALEQLRQRDSSEILEELKPLADAVSVEGLEKEFMVLNAPFLVERSRTEEFEEAAEKVAEDQQDRIEFTLLGPMPAYNFIDVEKAA